MADRGNDFFAEYPEDDLTCWLAATAGVFPVEPLREMLKDTRRPILEVDGVRTYKEGSPLRQYVCGIDGAGGIPGGDNAAAVVLCASTGEVMAVLQHLVGPDSMARTLA